MKARANPFAPAHAGLRIQLMAPRVSPSRRRKRPSLIWIAILAGVSGWMMAGAAVAGPVTLRANPVDDDGRVTLGEVFENAGRAADVVIASRDGPSVVLEAGQLQALALRAGLNWSNPQGLRRVVVRQAGAPSPAGSAPIAAGAARTGATVETLTYARSLNAGDIVRPEDVSWTPVQAHQVPAGAPGDADQVIGLSARRAVRAGTAVATRDLASPQVIARNDMVEVVFVSGGVRLSITGRATRNAAAGEAVPVLNLSSNRVIDAVATGPGQAVAGPGARAVRASSSQFASR